MVMVIYYLQAVPLCHSSSDTTWTLSEANKYVGVTGRGLTGRRQRQNLSSGLSSNLSL